MNTPTFFSTAAEFRSWLAKNAGSQTEFLVGLHKQGSGLPSMSWPESVDEALCFGWIDGVRTRIDEQSYKIRFTPRKPNSTWSAVNIKKFELLEAQGRMTEAGRRAFSHRKESNSVIYAYEQKDEASFSADDEAAFRSNETAWTFFESQPRWYRHLSAHRIESAKRPETKVKRLLQLIAASEKGVRL